MVSDFKPIFRDETDDYLVSTVMLPKPAYDWTDSCYETITWTKGGGYGPEVRTVTLEDARAEHQRQLTEIQGSR